MGDGEGLRVRLSNVRGQVEPGNVGRGLKLLPRIDQTDKQFSHYLFFAVSKSNTFLTHSVFSKEPHLSNKNCST